MSNNLDLTREAEAQTNPHIPQNDCASEVDALLSETISIGVTNTNAYTVTDAELDSGFHFIIGNGGTSATAAFIISLPASSKRGLTLWRNTLAYPATIRKVTSQTETVVTVPPNGSALIEYDGSNARLITALTPFSMVVPASDQSTPITAGTAKTTFPFPRRVWLTEVRGFLKTVQTSGSIFTVDVNVGGATILSTKITIDNTEQSSKTAATPPVLSVNAVADDAVGSIDVDQIGDSTAIGLMVTLIGYLY